MEKPVYQIYDWSITGNPVSMSMNVTGEKKLIYRLEGNKERNRRSTRMLTSKIVSIDLENNIVETMNSFYILN